MSEFALPEGFEDLEALSSWALETETERTTKRHACTMEELQVVYDALLPRTEAALAYLEPFPLENMPEDARNLFLLTLSLAEVAPAIEQFGQPSVVDGYDATRVIPLRRE